MWAMRLSAAAAAALLAALAPRAGRAEPLLALRLGGGAALGSAVADVPVADTVRFERPFLQLDALLKGGGLAGGVYGSWGWASVGECDGSCSGSVARLGIQATWTFPPARGVRGGKPWAGAALGWEWATEQRARGETEVETRWSGPELASQGGIDWRVGRWVALGPFLAFSFGRYTAVSVDTGLDSASDDIPDKAFHVWVQAGVRARLVLLGGDP
jgi:hypothetical protein